MGDAIMLVIAAIAVSVITISYTGICWYIIDVVSEYFGIGE